MNLPPFETELYYAEYEFSSPHLLSASDCQTMTVGELLELAKVPPEKLLELSLGYTESQGHPELREAIGYRYSLSADNVLVLGSPIEGLYLLSRLFEGETIVLTPAYDALRNLPAHYVPWQLLPTDTGWSLDIEALDQLATPDTQLLVVNFPHNPTGYVPTPEEWERLVEWAAARDIWLFCDEMYDGLLRPEVEPLPSAVGMYRRAIVLGGLSKSHGLPGLRCGWIASPDTELLQRFLALKMYTSICPPAPVEFLATVALSVEAHLVIRSNRLIEDNLTLAEAFFSRHTDLFCYRPPRGASVALVELLAESDAESWCRRLADQHGVVLLPGNFLGAGNRYVRFGFGRESFGEALAAFEKALNDQAR